MEPRQWPKVCHAFSIPTISVNFDSAGRDLNKSLLKRKEEEESLETDQEYTDDEEKEDVNKGLDEEEAAEKEAEAMESTVYDHQVSLKGRMVQRIPCASHKV